MNRLQRCCTIGHNQIIDYRYNNDNDDDKCQIKNKKLLKIQKKFQNQFEQQLCEQIYQVCCQNSLIEHYCNIGLSMAIKIMNFSNDNKTTTSTTTCQEQFLKNSSNINRHNNPKSYRCCQDCISGSLIGEYFRSINYCYQMDNVINHHSKLDWIFMDDNQQPQPQPQSTIKISPFLECCSKKIDTLNKKNDTSSTTTTIITSDDLDLNELDYDNNDDDNDSMMIIDNQNDQLKSKLIRNSTIDNNENNDYNKCSIGFQWDHLENICKDLNECQIGTHTCHEALRCDNTIGSFLCVRVQDCGTGYTINADTYECDDIDECKLNIHHCGSDYRCRNTQGSFKCDRIRCPQGQVLVNGFCRRTNCDQQQQSSNMMIFNYELGICQPKKDPCSNNPCLPTERCLINPNDADKFECVLHCSPGYRFNQKSKNFFLVKSNFD